MHLTKPKDYPHRLLFSDGEKIYWDSALQNSVGWSNLGIFWTSVDGDEKQPITEWDEFSHKHILEALFSPVNRKILFHLYNNGSYNWVLADLNGKNSGPILNNHIGAFWSPDGKYILFSTGIHNILFDLATAKKNDLPSTQAGKPVWSPDGRMIVFYGFYGSWELLDIENKTVKLLDFTTDWGNRMIPVKWIPAKP